jgi:hypothetical protein
LTGSQLRGLDQRGLIRATAPSWDIGQARFDITIGRVKHNPPRAQAQLVVNGTATNMWIEFVQVEDYWRLSERTFNEVFNQNVRDLARRMDRSEDYVVLVLARGVSGKSFDDRIWDAPPR